MNNINFGQGLVLAKDFNEKTVKIKSPCRHFLKHLQFFGANFKLIGQFCLA